MQIIKACAVALLGALALANPAEAETKASGKFSFNALTVKGLVIRDRYVIGEDFAKKNKVKVTTPFVFQAPRIKGVFRGFMLPAALGSPYLKVLYGKTDKDFFETIQFSPYTLQADNLKNRRQKLADYLKNIVWAQTVAGQGDNKLDVLRHRKLGKFEAVELIGRYIDLREGKRRTILTRNIALIRENSPHGIIAAINIDTAHVEVKSDKQMAETVSNDILESVKFQ